MLNLTKGTIMGKMCEKRLHVGKLVTEQKMSSKRRGHTLPAYTADGLWEWINLPENVGKFNSIWDNWKATMNRMDQIKDFRSTKKAMASVGMEGGDASPLVAAIKGRKKSYKGFKWRYKNV